MKEIKPYTGLLRLGGLLIVLPLLVWSWALRPTAELRRGVREQAARVEAAERSGAAVFGAQSAAPPLGRNGRRKDEAFPNGREVAETVAPRRLCSPPADSAAVFGAQSAAPPLGPNGRHEDGTIRSGAVLHRLAPALERCGVTAERYTPYRLGTEAGAECYAGELILGGGFHALTRLLDGIEKEGAPERVVSVGYAAAVDPRSREKALKMTVVFQQITQNTMP